MRPAAVVPPRVFEDAGDVRAWSRGQRALGRRVVFVPTMGALHAGHRSLLRAARRAAAGEGGGTGGAGDAVRAKGAVVASIFVNPAQFGPGEDLSRYPRPFAADLEACAEEGVEAVYAPSAAAMYAPDHSTWVMEDALSLPLEGALRPGHFRGVLTVVLKLFHAVEPDVAIFGQKDAQQALLIRRMTRDFDLPIEIRIEPTVRETDGLALSSRNAYLRPRERALAPALRRAIQACVERLEAGETDHGRVREAGLAILREGSRQGAAGGGGDPGGGQAGGGGNARGGGNAGGGSDDAVDLAIDYLEVVDAATLRAVGQGKGGIAGTGGVAGADGVAGAGGSGVLVAGAIRLGSTRLIDNALFVPGRRPGDTALERWTAEGGR